MAFSMKRRTFLAGSAVATLAALPAVRSAHASAMSAPKPLTAPTPKFEVLAEGLAAPEGPVAMADGSVLVVELAAGTLKRVWGQGKTEVIATPGGSTNGAAIGPDGAAYVVNNGGFSWVTDSNGKKTLTTDVPADYKSGWVDRVNLATGKIDRLYESCNGNRLCGPNDIVFDKHGGFWFTDAGRRYKRSRDYSGLYYALPDGSHIEEAYFGPAMLNGVGLSPDEKTLYLAQSDAGRLLALPLAGPGKLAAQDEHAQGLPVAGAAYAPARFDSLKVLANGDVAVATQDPGGITTLSVKGAAPIFVAIPDRFTTNLCFGGKDMRTAYITGAATGKLFKMTWPTAGLKLNYNA